MKLHQIPQIRKRTGSPGASQPRPHAGDRGPATGADPGRTLTAGALRRCGAVLSALCLLIPVSSPAADTQQAEAPDHAHSGMDHERHLQAMQERQREVAAHGHDVMPFDLAATQHVFTKTAGGGIQRVLTRDPGDAHQAHLIREHLQQIRQQFLAGDYSGPAHIHGAAMPGLEVLRAAPAGHLSIDYTELPGGAQLAFSSEDPALVAAVHRWFEAQLSDHGHDAVAGQPRE